MQHCVISFSDAIEFKVRSSRLRITKIPYKNENYRIVRIFIFHSSFTLRWSLHRLSGRKIKQQTKAYWQHKLPSIWQIKPYVYEIVEIYFYFYLLFDFLSIFVVHRLAISVYTLSWNLYWTYEMWSTLVKIPNSRYLWLHHSTYVYLLLVKTC